MKKILLRLTVSASIVALAACSGRSDYIVGATTPTTTTLDNLVSSIATPGQPSGVVGSTVALPGALTSPGNCSYTSTSQSFVCPTVTSNGLTVQRSYQLLDNNGAPQSSFGITTTRIRLTTDISGTVNPGSVPDAPAAISSMTLARHEVLTLSDLLSTTSHRIDGTSTSQMSTSVTTTPGSAPTPVIVAGGDTTTNLVVPATPGANGQSAYPLSGTIVNSQTTTVGSGSSATVTPVRAVTTFTGSATVTFTLTTGGRTITCTRSLVPGATQPSCS